MNIIEIIQEHLKKYPQMTAQDIIKLVYQNEFGGGHLIGDYNVSLLKLQEESQQINYQIDKEEKIGNNLIRIYLGNLNALELMTLNQIFVYSAKLIKGNIASLVDKLEVVQQACQIGQINYDYVRLTQAIEEYKQDNCPLISHSQHYHECYQPHYRVVDKSVYRYFEIILKINHLLINCDSLIITIDGKCGAGKSTLGKILQTIFEGGLFKMDDFFLQTYQRNSRRLNEPGGNVDYERFKATVVEPLLQQQDVIYQKFDCTKMALDNCKTIIPYHKINIIEGTYSMHPYFGKYYDYSIILNISNSLQEQRILKRNGIEMLEKFKNIWIPLENIYFDANDLFNKADYQYIKE